MRKTKTDPVSDYLRRLLNRGDFILTIYAPKGTGKSWAALGLCERIDSHFSMEREDRVIFKLRDIYSALEEGTKNKFSVYLLDDFGSELDPSEFMEEVAKAINHLSQKSRTLHIGLVITTPNRMYLNKTMRERAADHYMEVLGVKDGKNIVKLQRIEVNNKTGKVYHKNLLYSKDGFLNPKCGKKVTQYLLPAPSEDLTNWYGPKREKLAWEQLQESKRRAEAALEKKKTVQEIAEEISESIEDYMKETRQIGRKGMILDKGKIEANYSVGGRKSSQIEAILRQEGVI